jgi:hypothetical protein
LHINIHYVSLFGQRYFEYIYLITFVLRQFDFASLLTSWLCVLFNVLSKYVPLVYILPCMVFFIVHFGLLSTEVGRVLVGFGV